MTLTELIGWAAASMTLLAFTARDVRLLRLASVAASIAFITYGAAVTAWPVLALHCLLLPVNLLRLRELLRKPQQSPVLGAAGRAVAVPPGGPWSLAACAVIGARRRR